MLNNSINIGVLINLELAIGGIIELVSDGELGFDLLASPVVGELRTDSLAGCGGMTEVEPEFSECQRLLFSSDVLDAELGTCGGVPYKTELVVKNLLALDVYVEVGTEEIGLVKVRELDHGVE